MRVDPLTSEDLSLALPSEFIAESFCQHGVAPEILHDVLQKCLAHNPTRPNEDNAFWAALGHIMQTQPSDRLRLDFAPLWLNLWPFLKRSNKDFSITNSVMWPMVADICNHCFPSHNENDDQHTRLLFHYLMHNVLTPAEANVWKKEVFSTWEQAKWSELFNKICATSVPSAEEEKIAELYGNFLSNIELCAGRDIVPDVLNIMCIIASGYFSQHNQAIMQGLARTPQGHAACALMAKSPSKSVELWAGEWECSRANGNENENYHRVVFCWSELCPHIVWDNKIIVQALTNYVGTRLHGVGRSANSPGVSQEKANATTKWARLYWMHLSTADKNTILTNAVGKSRYTVNWARLVNALCVLDFAMDDVLCDQNQSVASEDDIDPIVHPTAYARKQALHQQKELHQNIETNSTIVGECREKKKI